MNKNKEPVNVAITNEPSAPGMPLLNLSMTDKLYLATARTSDETLHYVYSLFCRRCSPGSYAMMPETDIATFADVKAADVYHKTIKQAIAYNKQGRAFEAISDFVGNFIDDFEQRMR